MIQLAHEIQGPLLVVGEVSLFFTRMHVRQEATLSRRGEKDVQTAIVVQEALTKGEINDIRTQLPAEYNDLFEAGNQSEMENKE